MEKETFVVTIKIICEGGYSIQLQERVVVKEGYTNQQLVDVLKTDIQTRLSNPNKLGYVNFRQTDFHTVSVRPERVIAIDFKHL